MSRPSKRTSGSFWQNCQNRACEGEYQGHKGRRAQAMLTPDGVKVLCRPCQKVLKVVGEYLDQPTKTEKRQLLGTKGPTRKKVSARQAAKAQSRKVAKATTPKAKPAGRKRPAKKAA